MKNAVKPAGLLAALLCVCVGAGLRPGAPAPQPPPGPATAPRPALRHTPGMATLIADPEMLMPPPPVWLGPPCALAAARVWAWRGSTAGTVWVPEEDPGLPNDFTL